MNGRGDEAPAPRGLDRARQWGPEAAFLVVTTAAGFLAAGRWLDPAGDPGLWWSLAKRLASGEVYYRDVFLQYGPLSPYLFSLSGRPFGFSATWFLLINWVPAIAAGFLLLLASRPFLGWFERLVLVAALLGLSIFAPGAALLVLCYCPAAVHALCFSVGAFLLLRSRRVGWLPAMGAGALAGLALCAKQEIGVAALLGLCAPLLTEGRKALVRVSGCALGFLGIASLGVLFVLGSGASFESLRYSCHVWPVGSVPPEWQLLFRRVTGLTAVDPWRSLLGWWRELLKLVVLASLVGLMLGRERRAARWWPTLGLGVLLLVGDVFSGRDPLPNVRFAGLSMTAALVLATLGLLDRSCPERGFLVGFGLFAALVAARTAVSPDTSSHFSGASHFATALTGLLLLFCFVPRILPGGERPARVTRRAWALILFPLAAYSAWVGFDGLKGRFRVPVETPRGRVWVPDRVAALYRLIGQTLRPGERVLFVPETHAADVLYGLQSASPLLIHVPGWLDARAENLLILRLESQPPSAVVLLERPTPEFGVKPFGLGFGRLLSAWIDRHFAVAAEARAGKILRARPEASAAAVDGDRPSCREGKIYNPAIVDQSRYAAAGVDIDAKAAALARARVAIRSTFTSGVLGDVGGFGGLFQPDFSKYREPVLVGSTDGVGTKLKVAIATGRHDTCGADLVNHCVNDILVQGARPLFFLDYIATGKIEPSVLEQVIAGVARGCRENGTALIGGETAEMPGFYAKGEYDLAGTIVGVVERASVLDGSRIMAGDVVLGLPSAGLHTNGYSLARQVFFEKLRKKPGDTVKGLGSSIADALLAPHLSYLSAMEPVLDENLAHGMAHITGGGFYDNIPRVLPPGLDVVIKAGAWDVLPVFEVLEREGEVSFEEMHRVFNMGIGMVVFAAPADLVRIAETWKSAGQRWYAIGNVTGGGSGRVVVEPAPV